jgi:sugar phosphate isomerase/epimerase
MEFESEIQEYVVKYGEVPPPWIYSVDSHPLSIQWRMGEGEGFLMVFGEWFAAHFPDVPMRGEYFWRWAPPPRWLAWTAEVIWDLAPWEDEDFDYAPYFERLRALGFSGVDDYQADFDDEKWLRIERGELRPSDGKIS